MIAARSGIVELLYYPLWDSESLRAPMDYNSLGRSESSKDPSDEGHGTSGFHIRLL